LKVDELKHLSNHLHKSNDIFLSSGERTDYQSDFASLLDQYKSVGLYFFFEVTLTSQVSWDWA